MQALGEMAGCETTNPLTAEAEDEYAEFAALAQSARLNAFARAWTRKDAVVKAVGAGLALPLRGVRVTFDPDTPPRLISLPLETLDSGRWCIRDVAVPPGYAAAVAVRGEEVEVVLRAGG